MIHLGNRVSALLDGRLGRAEEERCWQHVHECHACRDLVEREGWVKTSLAQLSLGPAAASEALKVSLRDQPALLPPAFPTSTGSRGRLRGLAVIGGGAASACVVGVLALGVMGPSRVEPRPPTTDLSRPVGPMVPLTPVQSERDVERRRSPASTVPRTPRTGRIATVREKMPS